ncbi:MAG: ribosome small subunit-dependent GTPase A [Chloroflexia bacterium]|nr:ribosome small subunit-dependent GTPase A [Chloroflexia bacterium]
MVIRAYGKFFDVQVQADSRVLLATIKGSVRRERLRTDLVAVGDRVWVTDVGEDEGQIELVEPRTRVLARLARNTRDIEQVILANPDQVLFLFAAREPIPHRRMLDRFLILAETQKLPALIGVNKMDLDQATDGRSVAEKTFADYVPLYDVHFLSLVTSFGVERLRTALAGKITVVAGPSGVGKSSLLNALDPGHDRTIGSVSDHTGKGRHTTIATQLYQIGPATFVADTPGIRSLALDAVPLEDLAQAFPEFRPLLGECFYSDCTHVHEPGCAIREALAAGTIAPARYESYAALRRGDTIDLAAAENLDGP